MTTDAARGTQAQARGPAWLGGLVLLGTWALLGLGLLLVAWEWRWGP